jgi:hypothetical protein
MRDIHIYTLIVPHREVTQRGHGEAHRQLAQVGPPRLSTPRRTHGVLTLLSRPVAAFAEPVSASIVDGAQIFTKSSYLRINICAYLYMNCGYELFIYICAYRYIYMYECIYMHICVYTYAFIYSALHRWATAPRERGRCEYRYLHIYIYVDV